MTVAVEAHIEGLAALGAGLERMAALGQQPRPIWEAIGNQGETSTKLRFVRGIDPDRKKWLPSLRVKQGGGFTMRRSNRLMDSITHNSTNSGTAWGTNVKYAGIHQFGGVIKAKGGGNLRFKIGGRFVSVKAVTIPKRSFVGVNADDAGDILHVAQQEIDKAARNRGAA